jgi:hypothetical protein
MKFLRIGQAINALELSLIGPMSKDESTYPCQGTSTKHYNGSGMNVLEDCKIRHTPMWHQHMVQRHNTWSMKSQVSFSTKKGKNIFKPSPEHCCITVMQWTPLCLLH